MRVFIGQRNGKLACHGIGFGNLFRFQPFPFEHVHEIGISTEIELVSMIQSDPAVPKQIRQDTVCYRCTDLGFYVVTDDWQPTLGKTILPIGARGDEHWNTINKCTTR